jgi:hypothetical protein
MTSRFADAMKRQTDAELRDIAACTTDEWHPDSIAAARDELAARGVPEVDDGPAESPATIKARDFDEYFWMSLVFPGIGVLLAWRAASKFARQGNHKRAKEIKRVALLGVAASVVVGVVLRTVAC